MDGAGHLVATEWVFGLTAYFARSEGVRGEGTMNSSACWHISSPKLRSNEFLWHLVLKGGYATCCQVNLT
jgi:hypothetical protein